MHTHRRFLLLSLTLLSAVLLPALPAAADPTGDAMIVALEKRLLSAQAIRFQLDVKSDGANPSELRGEYDLRQGNRVWIRAAGTFRGDPVDLQLKTDRDQLAGRVTAGKPVPPAKLAVATEFSNATPATVNENLLLRLVRIGILHDLATLSAKKPPDIGDMRTQFQLRDVRVGGDKVLDGKVARPLRYTIVVGNKDMGAATLWLDLNTGLPMKREQVIHFAEGDMNLTERYDRFETTNR